MTAPLRMSNTAHTITKEKRETVYQPLLENSCITVFLLMQNLIRFSKTLNHAYGELPY